MLNSNSEIHELHFRHQTCIARMIDLSMKEAVIFTVRFTQPFKFFQKTPSRLVTWGDAPVLLV